MSQREIYHIIAAMIMMTVIVSFNSIIKGDFLLIPMYAVFSIIIILVSVLSKKIAADHYDADIEHELWKMERYGLPQAWRLAKPVPVGIIFPLFFTVFSLGFLKPLTFLTFEIRALKRRAARRHGYYSYAEMTDWHVALISAFSILCLLALGIIAYFTPLPNSEVLAKLAIFYAFWNMIPISKLDGTQLLFSSRIIYIIVGIITLICTSFALLIGNLI